MTVVEKFVRDSARFQRLAKRLVPLNCSQIRNLYGPIAIVRTKRDS